MTLLDFAHPEEAEAFSALDDRVMGGVSQSEFISVQHQDRFQAVFRGAVSLDNNGGFCSIRTSLAKPVAADAEHLWIQCHNEIQWGAKTYYLNLRINGGFDGVSYRAAFTPTSTSLRYEFTATEFAAVFRGRPVPEAPALHFAAVEQIGLMIADSQTGPFALYIAKIGIS